MGRVKQGRGTLLGNAGEHYVVAELLRRDIIADRAPRNTPFIDIMATTGPKSVNVRVKTRSDEADSWVWIVKKNGTLFQNVHETNDFTVLVHVPDSGSPIFWIIPTKALEEKIIHNHDKWLSSPGRNGRPHSTLNTMRRLGGAEDDRKWLEQFKNKWELIIAKLSK